MRKKTDFVSEQDTRPGADAPEVLREDRTGDLTKRMTAAEGMVWAEYLAKTGRAEVELRFLIGPDTPACRDAVQSLPIRGLSSNARTGLAAILRRSAEPDDLSGIQADGIVPEGSMASAAGNCDAALEVENGRIVYTVTPCCAGCSGHARIDLGAATPGRCIKMLRTCERFYDNWLEPYVWIVKHEYIDHGGYEEWTPEDEE